MIFPVVMYGCELNYKEGWELKNWCFQTVELEKILRVPWTAKRSNQSILKEINSEYSLEGLMLKLKLQNLGHLMWRADSLENILMLWKIEGRRREREREDEMSGCHHWLNGYNFEQTQQDCKGQGSLVCCSPWVCRVGLDWATEQQPVFLSISRSILSSSPVFSIL